MTPLMMPHPCPSSSRLLKTFLNLKPLVHNGKITNFRGILGQSWNSEIHKVKLLKLQNFNFDLKFLWNLSVFHYEPKILDLKKYSVTRRQKHKGVASSWEWHAYFSLGHFTPYRPILCTIWHTTVAPNKWVLRGQVLNVKRKVIFQLVN